MSTLRTEGQALCLIESGVTISGESQGDDVELASSQRDKILRFLSDLHPREMRILELCEAILAENDRQSKVEEEEEEEEEASTDSIENYSLYTTAPAAIVAYLRAHGPTSRKNVTAEVVRGGYGKNNPDKTRKQRTADVRSAITYQLTKAVVPVVGIREHDKFLYAVEEKV